MATGPPTFILGDSVFFDLNQRLIWLPLSRVCNFFSFPGFFYSLQLFVPTAASIYIATQYDSDRRSNWPATRYGSDNYVTTANERFPVSRGHRIVWCRQALTMTRRVQHNQPQHENLLSMAVLGPNYEQLYWYVNFSYVYTMVISGIWNGGGIWCCWVYILIAPHHSCWFLLPKWLSQTQELFSAGF